MTEISFCPLCAGKLEATDDEQFACQDCDTQFFIQIVDAGDNDDLEDDEDEDDLDEDEDDEDEDEDEENFDDGDEDEDDY